MNRLLGENSDQIQNRLKQSSNFFLPTIFLQTVLVTAVSLVFWIRYSKSIPRDLACCCDEDQKARLLASQNLPLGRWKSFLACADITKDSAVLISVRGYVELSTASLIRRDELEYIPC